MSTTAYWLMLWTGWPGPWPWLAATAVLLGVLGRYAPARRPMYLVAACSALTLALASPIAVLAGDYLFSAHVAQHLLLLLVVPALLLRAFPSGFPARAKRLEGALAEAFSRPVSSWLLGLGAMWFWHVPRLCSASIASQEVFGLQVATLLGAGLAFYMPVSRPSRERRLSPPAAIAYLTLACFCCTALGIWLTFSPVSVCPIYSHNADPRGLLSTLRAVGLTHGVDQQVGGLLMWIPACFVYLVQILVIVSRWFGEDEPVVGRGGERHGA